MMLPPPAAAAKGGVAVCSGVDGEVVAVAADRAGVQTVGVLARLFQL